MQQNADEGMQENEAAEFQDQDFSGNNIEHSENPSNVGSNKVPKALRELFTYNNPGLKETNSNVVNLGPTRSRTTEM